MENQKLQKYIMLFLKGNPIHMVELSGALAKKFSIPNLSDAKVACNLKLLEEKGLVHFDGKLNLGSHLRLSEQGYRNLDHWSKKKWRWFKEHFIKILSSMPSLVKGFLKFIHLV